MADNSILIFIKYTFFTLFHKSETKIFFLFQSSSLIILTLVRRLTHYRLWNGNSSINSNKICCPWIMVWKHPDWNICWKTSNLMVYIYVLIINQYFNKCYKPSEMLSRQTTLSCHFFELNFLKNYIIGQNSKPNNGQRLVQINLNSESLL